MHQVMYDKFTSLFGDNRGTKTSTQTVLWSKSTITDTKFVDSILEPLSQILRDECEPDILHYQEIADLLSGDDIPPGDIDFRNYPTANYFLRALVKAITKHDALMLGVHRSGSMYHYFKKSQAPLSYDDVIQPELESCHKQVFQALKSMLYEKLLEALKTATNQRTLDIDFFSCDNLRAMKITEEEIYPVYGKVFGQFFSERPEDTLQSFVMHGAITHADWQLSLAQWEDVVLAWLNAPQEEITGHYMSEPQYSNNQETLRVALHNHFQALS